MYEPKYASQTKERLAIRKEQLSHLVEPLKVKLYEYLKKNENFRNEVLNKIDSYRKKLSASEVITRSDERLNSRVSLNLDGNLRNCSSNDVSKCSLFICEGASASGGLIQCRDPRYHALMPLKGKIMNVCGSSKEYFKNKEIVELINALGCGVETDCKVSLLKYHSINICCDGDADGCPHQDEQIYIKQNDQIKTINFKDLFGNKNLYENQSETICYDEENKVYCWGSIEKIWPFKEFNDWVIIELENGEEFNVTPDHLILTDKGYIEAKNLTYEHDIISISRSEKESKRIMC